MSRRLLIVAVLVVLASNAWLASRALANRRGVDATVTLTEREAPLVSGDAQNTAYMVRLTYAQAAPWALPPGIAGAVGFDSGTIEAVRSHALWPHNVMRHMAWAALEARPEAVSPDESALTVVDVDVDPEALRARHPDRSHAVVTRVEVGILETLSRLDDKSGRRPTVVVVTAIVPALVAVPRELRAVFEHLPARADGSPPRYTITLNFGRHHEPWMVAAERLPPASPITVHP